MGLKRIFKKKFLGGGSLINGHIADALLKQKETGKSFRECLKESIKETFTEDTPGLSHVYRQGQLDGKKAGVAEQAQKDEIKFKDLHEKHEKDRKAWNKQKEDYENLLDDIEDDIENS